MSVWLAWQPDGWLGFGLAEWLGGRELQGAGWDGESAVIGTQ